MPHQPKNHNSFPFSSRITALQSSLSSDSGVFLSHPSDIAYYTGFPFLVPAEREAALLILPRGAHLFRAALTPFAAPTGVSLYDQCHPHALDNHIRAISAEAQINTLHIDEDSLFVGELHAIQAALPNTQVIPLQRAQIWRQRMVKDPVELAKVAQASQLTKQLLEIFPSWLEAGKTELELAWECETWLRSQGADGLAFPTIVAFGPHSALPHHQPDETPLTQNAVVLLDVGARRHGYASDATRTWWFGARPSPQFQQAEEVVHTAYSAALVALKKSTHRAVTAADIDRAARHHIDEAGWSEAFIHTTGHGLGLDIHEPPSLNTHNPEPLRPDMIITIEPGVYFPGEFGYRYENTVALHSSGVTELTL